MAIWFIFIIMTAAVLAGLILPMLRGGAGTAADRSSFDKAVFRDQLAEIDRDLARGIIGPAEADAARNEISRRLISAAKPPDRLVPGPIGKSVLALIATLIVPAVALPLYLKTGRPGLPDVPHAPRLENAVENNDFVAMVAKVEAHLAGHPDDVQGWAVLAPAYKREQRWADAADAYANILRLSQPTAETISDYAEMLVFAKDGLVTADARRAFSEALKLDPKAPKARFFAGIALKQEGKVEEAKAALQAFLDESPKDASWRPMVEAELKDMASHPPVLSEGQMAAGSNLKAAGQQAMIRSMVDGLEAKLQADASNLDGWLRLIRARTVLNETDRARQALATAKQHFKGQPEALTSLDGLAKELGIR